MESTAYRCPLCHRTMERNLVLFLRHTDQHVIDQIKKEHPEWVAEDGVCKPCSEYYQGQLNGESPEVNIGPQGRRNRFWMGLVSLGVGWVLAFRIRNQSNPFLTAVLFFPFFAGMLGLFQAREKTCALLAARGLRNMDQGPAPVSDSKIAGHLRRRGQSIFIKSALAALLLTLVTLLM